ncbi:MAG: hypothetical protein KJ869_02310, partial [Candidatus Edwardsbacteria bacterium]|nr:hypothetical protein [Candidatus Edwardsbacteria bacterium]
LSGSKIMDCFTRRAIMPPRNDCSLAKFIWREPALRKADYHIFEVGWGEVKKDLDSCLRRNDKQNRSFA